MMPRFRISKRLPGRPNARRRRSQRKPECNCRHKNVQRFLRRTKEKGKAPETEELHQEKRPKPDCELNPDRFATMIVERERIRTRLGEGEDLENIQTDEEGNILDFAIACEGDIRVPSVMENMIEIASKAKNISDFARMALIASITMERKGDSGLLNRLCEQSEMIGIQKIFVSALAGAIRDRDLRRFRMAFEISE